MGGGPAYSKRMKMRKKRKVVSNKAGNGDLHHLKLFQIITSPPLTFKKSSIMYVVDSVSIYNSLKETAYCVFFSPFPFFFLLFFWGGGGGGSSTMYICANNNNPGGGLF